jgi:AraC-like DNA-binding protein
MGQLFGLSEIRFRHLFKLNTGKAFSQRLREARMTRAGRFLEQPDLPIKEIAHECGYDDVSNFYRDFRKVHGMSPQKLRIRYLELLYQAKKRPLGTTEIALRVSDRKDMPLPSAHLD